MPHKDNRTRIAAIMNLTPDSFSDGGELLTLEAVQRRVHHLCALGVDAIDVGAESTRPGAVLLDSTVEWERLQPFLLHIIAILV
jgi:dihydropteroate synthase